MQGVQTDWKLGSVTLLTLLRGKLTHIFLRVHFLVRFYSYIIHYYY